MGRCGLPTIKKRENQQKKELEKSASITRSILDMFLVKSNKILSIFSPTFSLPIIFSSKKLKE